MPRAVTRAISTSFATRTRSRGSSVDLPSSKASSNLDLFPSPRPSKAMQSSSKRSAPSSSPLARGRIESSDPHTPPQQKTVKRKRIEDVPTTTGKVAKMPERQINTFLANYDLEAENRIRMANQALQVSIESARAQMIASISAFPRSVLVMRLEEYLTPTAATAILPAVPPAKDVKRSSGYSVPSALSHRTPRAAKPGEVVYSARGSPILVLGQSRSGVVETSDEEEEEGEEPFFDTASDKSTSSESFSLPDEAAYTAQVMEQERNRILSSEGFFPRSSSMFHRSSSS